MSAWSILVTPFAEYAFMRTALVTSIALAVASGPLGTLLLLRRMGLVGNVLSHAVMPGAAIGFALAGGGLAVLSIGGLITGIAVVLLMLLGTRFGEQREDASLAAFYLRRPAWESSSCRCVAPTSISCTCCLARFSRSTSRRWF